MSEIIDKIPSKDISQTAHNAINFILDYQPYKCFDAAPRVLAVLLCEGIPQDQSNC
jgi:hypothetical protein